jgi:hypothetical protein
MRGGEKVPRQFLEVKLPACNRSEGVHESVFKLGSWPVAPKPDTHAWLRVSLKEVVKLSVR